MLYFKDGILLVFVTEEFLLSILGQDGLGLKVLLSLPVDFLTSRFGVPLGNRQFPVVNT